MFDRKNAQLKAFEGYTEGDKTIEAGHFIVGNLPKKTEYGRTIINKTNGYVGIYGLGNLMEDIPDPRIQYEIEDNGPVYDRWLTYLATTGKLMEQNIS